MSHKRATPKDTKPIDTDAMGYDDREHEHGQHLPAGHPQRRSGIPAEFRIGPNGGTVRFTRAAQERALAAANAKPSRLARARAVADAARRVLFWTIAGLIVAGGIAALAGWWTS